MAYIFGLIFVGFFSLGASGNPLFSQEGHPPPFEKIYVTPSDILSTPEGTFYISPEGKQEKVRAIRSDHQGTYIIKFLRKCPVCERYYSGDTPEEGYDCPLWSSEVLPHLWCK